MKNENNCKISVCNSFFYVSFFIGDFCESTESYRKFYEASEAMENWLDKGLESGFNV